MLFGGPAKLHPLPFTPRTPFRWPLGLARTWLGPRLSRTGSLRRLPALSLALSHTHTRARARALLVRARPQGLAARRDFRARNPTTPTRWSELLSPTADRLAGLGGGRSCSGGIRLRVRVLHQQNLAPAIAIGGAVLPYARHDVCPGRARHRVWLDWKALKGARLLERGGGSCDLMACTKKRRAFVSAISTTQPPSPTAPS